MDEFDEALALDDEAMAAFLDGVGEMVEADEARTAWINIDRIRAVAAVFKLMQANAQGRGVRVSCQLHEPYKSMGSVSVTGKRISFPSPGCLARAARLADNFELYPKTDGSVHLTFTFHGLTKPIE